MISWWVVRVLLDESIPRQLASLLTEHRVSTVPRQGWSGLGNGELLRRASGEFDVLVTGDQNLEYQQNLVGLGVGIIVISAPNNRVETITGLAPRIAAAIVEVRPGQVVRVST